MNIELQKNLVSVFSETGRAHHAAFEGGKPDHSGRSTTTGRAFWWGRPVGSSSQGVEARQGEMSIESEIS